MLTESFGIQLKKNRRLHGLTQKQMAASVGVTFQYYGRIERGEVSPSFGVIENICRVLEIEAFNLFLFAEESGPSADPSSLETKLDSHALSPLFDGPRPVFIGNIHVKEGQKAQTWSTSLFTMLGYSQENVAPTTARLLRHIHPLSKNEFSAFLKAALAGNPHMDLLFWFYRTGARRIEKGTDIDQLAPDILRFGLVHAEYFSATEAKPAWINLTLMDVTEWKDLEQALLGRKSALEHHVRKRSEELAAIQKRNVLEIRRREQLEADLHRFTKIISASDDAQAFVDANANYHIVNEAYLRHLGMKRAQVVGRKVANVVGKELFASEIEPYLDKALAGEPVNFIRQSHFAGSLDRQQLVSYTPYHHDGEIGGVLVNLRDITELKALEQLCQRQQLLYQIIVETASEGIRIVDTEGKITFVNPQGAAMLGLTPSKMEGHLVSEFLHPGDISQVEKRIRQRQKGTRDRYVVRHLHSDGHTIWTQISVTPLHDEHGDIYGSLGMITDITKIKQIETDLRASRQFYRALIQKTNVIILRLDIEGRILFINDYGLQVLGYSFNEVVGRSVLETILPEQDDSGRDMADMLQNILVQPEDFAVNEHFNRCRNGSLIRVRWTNQPVYDKKLALTELLCAGQVVDLQN